MVLLTTACGRLVGGNCRAAFRPLRVGSRIRLKINRNGKNYFAKINGCLYTYVYKNTCELYTRGSKYCIVLRRYIWGVVLYRVHGKRDGMWTAGGMYTNITSK